ncbi:transmembrane protein 231-like [Macrosteles quadrilineatus]|uniref:transmembrane protein 231-like n=1 Tax=Macrosteles quadrilineatus TaxID=74068 RepID=UPI0023E0F1A0|nr:transmembrane protein 231-like [Macrosteles quadrilineatus]
MAVYNVFSSCICYNYKTYVCSKATVVLVILSVMTVIFPLIFTYKSHGFWQRTDTYQEQPKVNFLYDYVIFFDVLKSSGKRSDDGIFLCSNLERLTLMTRNHNHCPFIKAYEEDINADGFNDLLKFETKLFLPPGSHVNGLSIMLMFDYKLSSYCRAQLEGAAYVYHSSPVSGAGVSVIGDLSLVQRQPLNPRGLDLRYNKTVVPMDINDNVFLMSDILMAYAQRNLTTRLTNVYISWITKRVDAEPFTVDVTVMYPETTVRYTPTTWQVMRLAWTQFFPVLIVFVYLFKSIKEFIFSNQLVTTYREEPRVKGY